MKNMDNSDNFKQFYTVWDSSVFLSPSAHLLRTEIKRPCRKVFTLPIRAIRIGPPDQFLIRKAKNNAGDGTWTHTILRPQAPEACASANSATPAFLVLRLSCAVQQNIYYQMIPNLSTAFFKFFQKISNFLFCPEKPAIRRAFREILHHLDSRQEIAVSSAIPKKIQKSETLNTSLRNFSGPNRKLT